jgi:ribokinase
VITVIGSINLDLIATVERIPQGGETVPGHEFKTSPGGKGANQALAAARAGAQVRMVGAVGKDSFAAEALELLKQAGIDLSSVRETHAATGIASIMVADDGENVIAVVPGANGAVLPGDVRNAQLAKGQIVLLQHEIPLESVEAALNAAREAGAISILNTAPARKDATALISQADYIVANETEFDIYADALSLKGADRKARMEAFTASTGSIVVVTLGGEGVLASTPEGLLSVSALPITPVDTVGAGDTFCGYLAAGLAAGKPLEEALTFAAAAGSLACLKPGAQPAIPLAKDVEAALTV